MSKALYKCSLLYYLLKKAYSLSQGTCDDSLIWGGEQYTQVQILKSQLDCLPAIYTKRILSSCTSILRLKGTVHLQDLAEDREHSEWTVSRGCYYAMPQQVLLSPVLIILIVRYFPLRGKDPLLCWSQSRVASR